MKVFIWFACIFVCSFINTALNTSGILLGGIPTIILYGSTIWIAITLCKKYEENKKNSPDKKIEIQKDAGTQNTVNFDKICFCRKCGEKLIDNSKSCSICGTEIIDLEKDA